MLTDKIFRILQDNLYIDHSYNPGYSTIEHREDCAQLIVELFTPKLEWKSEEVTNAGGDNLLATIYCSTDFPDTAIYIYSPVKGSTYVNWNGNELFEGTVDECKKYCSDKILEDFLKLCE